MAADRPSSQQIIALEQKAFSVAFQTFNSADRPELVYHSWTHTQKVYNDALQLCKAMHIDPFVTSEIGISALFHDIGHFTCDYGHEHVSAEMARIFLIDHHSTDISAIIEQNILATENGQMPATLSQRILKDADLLYIAEPHFLDNAELLRKEWAIRRGITFSDKDWLLSNLSFLSAHEFFTSYAKDNYNAQKQRNIEHLHSLLS